MRGDVPVLQHDPVDVLGAERRDQHVAAELGDRGSPVDHRTAGWKGVRGPGDHRRQHAGLLLAAVDVRPSQVVALARDGHLVVRVAAHLPAGPVIGDHHRAVVQPVEPFGVADAQHPGRGLSLRVDPEHLSIQAARILRSAGLARISGTDVESAVGAEANSPAIVEARGANSGDHDLVHPGAVVVLRQRPTLELVLGPWSGQIEEKLRLVARVHRDAEQPALAGLGGLHREHGRRHQLAVLEQPHASRALGDQDVAAGKEGEAPRDLEAAHHRLGAERNRSVRPPRIALLQQASRQQRKQDHGRTSVMLEPWLAGRARRQQIERMASTRQKAAARRNIKKAAVAARRKKTISRLPRKTRTALARQANKVKRKRRR